MSEITLDVLKDLMPKKTRSMASQELVDKINGWNDDPKLLGGLSTNVLSYIGVLKAGSYRIGDYMNAVRFVSYKLIGHSDIDAYATTFPERYQRLIDKGETRSDIGPYVSIYKTNELVVKILEQTIIPTHVLNAPMHQEALNELMRLGLNAKSEIARVNALNGVLTHTKAPETAKIQLDVNIDRGTVIDDYEQAMRAMVAQQKDLISQGGDLKAITNASIKRPEEPIIDVEVDDELSD